MFGRIIVTKQTTHKMNNYEDSPLCTLFILIVSLLILCSRNVDENGMDTYDRSWGISGEGRERGMTGIIYTNGQVDFWANLFDHNPWWD